jgi:hypothetical protein
MLIAMGGWTVGPMDIVFKKIVEIDKWKYMNPKHYNFSSVRGQVL